MDLSLSELPTPIGTTISEQPRGNEEQVRALTVLLSLWGDSFLRQYSLRFHLNPSGLTNYQIRRTVAEHLVYLGYGVTISKVGPQSEISLPNERFETSVPDVFLSQSAYNTSGFGRHHEHRNPYPSTSEPSCL